MQNVCRNDLLSDKEQLQNLPALCYGMVSVDGGACRQPETSGRNVIRPLWHRELADGPVAEGDAVAVFLLALADVSMGTSYSIFGLHPYAAPPMYLST